jgi:multidrug efflux pump subunit AcrA (membrane-fusion protein)
VRLRIALAAALLGLLGAIAWCTARLIRVAASPVAAEVPCTRVKRGRVTVSVTARGELQGGNSEMLMAPMVGSDMLAITLLRGPGEAVKEGDVIVQFDTTQQEYNLREAEADLAESDQQVIQAEAAGLASEEETAYALAGAESGVKLAELEARKNELIAKLEARQNEITLEQARNRLRQARQDVNNKKSTSAAAIAIQKANQNKARLMAQMAQRNIESMTLKAKTSGYVNIQPNSFTNVLYTGMMLQPFQLGDTVRPGMAVAQIPDLESWEVSARVGELDRGHLAVGQPVSVAVVALPGKAFPGRVKTLGATTGPAWDRRFECRIALEQPVPEMRPGMTTNMAITAGTLDNVLWVPSQALNESDGRNFVYVKTAAGFMPRDVTLVRRSESQAVVTGVQESELVAMSSPDQQNKAAAQQNDALRALSK